jgi:branched-chain amino acid transport system permease protein
VDFLAAYGAVINLTILNCGLAFSQAIAFRAGVFSLATAGLAAVGAYTAAILAKSHGLHPVPALVAGTAAGALAAFLLSLPLSRLRGVFQAIATLAFVQIVVSLLLYAEPLTGGAMGLNGIPKRVDTPGLLVFLGGLSWLYFALGRTGLGRAFDALRQDELVAASFGIKAARHHSIAFVLSGAIAGLTGGLIAFHNYSLVPEEFGFGMLVAALAFVVLGGRTTVGGPIAGAVILTLLPEFFRVFADYRLLLHGVLLIAVIVYLQHGAADTLVFRWRQRRTARSAT